MNVLTDDEKRQAQEAIFKAWASAPAQLPASTAVQGLAAADLKKLFCDNWDTAKQVLQFLETVVPAPIKWAVAGLISAGDAIKPVVCK